MANLPLHRSKADKFFGNLKDLAFSDPEDVKECPMCLEKDKAPTVTLPACKHEFHVHCLRLSIESTCRNHNRCPICRTVILDDGLPLAGIRRRRWTIEAARDGQPLLNAFSNRDEAMQLALVNQVNAHFQARLAPMAGQRTPALFQPPSSTGNGPLRFDYAINSASHPGPQSSSLSSYSDHSHVRNWLDRFGPLQHPVGISLPGSSTIRQPTYADVVAHNRLHTRPQLSTSFAPRPILYPALQPGATLFEHLTIPHENPPDTFSEGELRGQWPYQWPSLMQPNPHDPNDIWCYRLATRVVNKRR
jgi:hypothetical protein